MRERRGPKSCQRYGRWPYCTAIATLLVVAGLAACAGKVVGTPAPGGDPLGIPGNWNLVLNSDFSGSQLDTSVWQTGWFGAGVTQPVNAYEEDCYSPANVTFPGDGAVQLEATAVQSTCGGKTHPYTGALISTNPDDRRGGGFQFTYGVVQALAYMPPSVSSSIAAWPAIWAGGQDWPADGEDDIMEGLEARACFHFHYSSSGSAAMAGSCVTGNFSGWHTFAADWERGSITYYYDGNKVGQISTGVTSSPMYLIIDNTIRPDAGPLVTPDDLQVRYVKVWQQSP